MQQKNLILAISINILFSSLFCSYSDLSNVELIGTYYGTIQQKTDVRSLYIDLAQQAHLTISNTTYSCKSANIITVNHMNSYQLAEYCKNKSAHKLFTKYHLYACPNYLNYIRLQPGYENFILKLHKKIQDNHDFRKSLRYMPGFKGKSGFHNFISYETQNIENAQALRLQKDNLRKQQEAEVKRREESQPHLDINNSSSFAYFTQEGSQNYHDDQILASRRQQRVDALKATKEQNGKQFDYSNMVKHPSFTDPYADVFNHCYGTALDKQLHEELCDTRTVMMQLASNYPELIQVKTICPVVYHFTALAKEQSSSEIAFNLSDFCYHLTKATQIVLKGTCKGVINTVEHNVAFCKSLVTHPIDDIVKPLSLAGIALGKAVYHATDLAINDPQNFKKEAKALAASIGQYVRNNPEEAIAGVVELLLPFSAPKLAKLKQVQTLVTAVQEQENILRAMQLSSKVATKIATPIKEVLADAGAIIDIGLQHGKVAMQNLIKVVEQQPELVSAGDIAELKLPSKCFDSFEGLAKRVGEHCEEFGTLKAIEDGIWKSPQGLIYGYDKKFGNRIQHVLAHALPNQNKNTHTVFNATKNKILELVDEAWLKKGPPLTADPGAYIVNVGKIIGTKGETAIKIIVKPGTNEIITAYPIKI